MNNSPRFFFTKRHGSTSSINGGRGRTNATGRGRHELLNMHFFTLKSGKSMRERLDTFATVFFTFKSKRAGRRFVLLNFENSNSRMNALVRVGIDGSNAWI